MPARFAEVFKLLSGPTLVKLKKLLVPPPLIEPVPVFVKVTVPCCGIKTPVFVQSLPTVILKLEALTSKVAGLNISISSVTVILTSKVLVPVLLNSTSKKVSGSGC